MSNFFFLLKRDTNPQNKNNSFECAWRRHLGHVAARSRTCYAPLALPPPPRRWKEREWRAANQDLRDSATKI